MSQEQDRGGRVFTTHGLLPFALCELVAVPLCAASWHAIVVEDEIARGIVGLAFGILIGLLGLSFLWWWKQLQQIAGAVIYWWPIPIILAFIYVCFMPTIEEKRWPFSAWFPPSPTLDQAADAIADKLAGRFSWPKPDDFAAAVVSELPKKSFPSADEIANAVVPKLPKQLPVQAPLIPSAADIAKEVVRQSPQPPDNQGQRVQELTAALNASNKARDEVTQELNALRNKLPPKSPILGIDDATKWQLVKSIQDAAVNSQGNNQIECPTIESIENQSKDAVELFSEFTELLARSWRFNERIFVEHGGFMSTQGAPPPPHQPFGITFLVAGHSGDAFACANHAVGVLQNVLRVPISLRVDQASDNLAKCNNECIEIRYGGER